MCAAKNICVYTVYISKAQENRPNIHNNPSSQCGRLTNPMLSAVENHFGPNRSYASGGHHYTGNSATGISGNPLNAPCPINLPLTNPMASAEFARPHPKTNR